MKTYFIPIQLRSFRFSPSNQTRLSSVELKSTHQFVQSSVRRSLQREQLPKKSGYALMRITRNNGGSGNSLVSLTRTWMTAKTTSFILGWIQIQKYDLHFCRCFYAQYFKLKIRKALTRTETIFVMNFQTRFYGTETFRSKPEIRSFNCY